MYLTVSCVQIRDRESVDSHINQSTKRNPKYVAVNEALQRLADNTFGVGLPNIQQVMHYLDAVAYQLWDLKH